MPGSVNAHMHWQEERQPGIPQPIQYERNLYLAAGVTTAREVGGDFDKSKKWQAESNAHTIVAPRILVYPFVSKGRTGSPAEIRAWIRDIKQKGADGLKIIGMDRDELEAIMSEAHALGMRTATHIAVEETTAKDYAELGVSSIEHFYGVADAALNGIQDFPPDTSYSNEIHRFGRAGEIYAQADPAKLHKIIDLMVEKHVVWDPTFSIYEASRDLMRAQNQPWFRDYLHPSLENLKLLNPYGADIMLLNGRPAPNYSAIGPNDRVQAAHGGGIEWTIKDGIPYHVPTLMREVKEMVTRARTQHPRTTAPAP